ncbi:MAG: sigma-54-dependent Fis family transcriptional regulator, partial [Myxococcota bacterium]
PERLRFERDLYKSILGLNSSEALQSFLDSALELVMSITGSRRGLLGLGGAQDEGGMPAEWWASRHEDGELEPMKRRVSSAIVRQALAEGRRVETPSAFLDPRFEGRDSVRSQQIESVLCVPIGDRIGVVYLEGHRRRGPFPKADVEHVELFAREVERIATRLLVERRRQNVEDATREFRERMRLDSIVGSSQVLADMLSEIEVCARSKASVLLTGASGTGKSAIAQVIHHEGPRSSAPFVALNCAAVPENLIESELFGNEEGAFSGATRAREGHIGAAEGGTLFLDEVAELSASAQAKLLQFLNDKVYYRVGSSTPLKADVRIISATNANLEELVKEKKFRPDLFYRLEVLPVRVPSLSERRADIPALLDHFADMKAKENQVARPAFSPSAVAAAEVADWHGNIRQLAAQVERAVIRAAQQGRTEIDAKLLFDHPLDSQSEASSLSEAGYPDDFHESTRQFHRSHVKRILQETNGRMTEAARRLGIARSYLYNLKKTLDLDDPKD